MKASLDTQTHTSAHAPAAHVAARRGASVAGPASHKLSHLQSTIEGSPRLVAQRAAIRSMTGGLAAGGVVQRNPLRRLLGYMGGFAGLAGGTYLGGSVVNTARSNMNPSRTGFVDEGVTDETEEQARESARASGGGVYLRRETPDLPGVRHTPLTHHSLVVMNHEGATTQASGQGTYPGSGGERADPPFTQTALIDHRERQGGSYLRTNADRAQVEAYLAANTGANRDDPQSQPTGRFGMPRTDGRINVCNEVATDTLERSTKRKRKDEGCTIM